jgi:OMF family outer membrane factor
MRRVNIHTVVLVLGVYLPIGLFAQENTWSLDQCIDSALVYNKNLQINRNSISIAEEKNRETKANLIPKVMLNADYKYFTNLPYQLLPLSVFGGPDGQFKEAQFGVPHNINANLQLSMPLYNSQIFGGIKMTETAIELQELQQQKSEEQIVFEITNIYYNLQLIQKQKEFLDSNKTNAEKLLSTMKLLQEQLLAKGTDVSKVELQLAQLETQIATVNSKREQLLAALKFAMGLSDLTPIQIDSDIQAHQVNEYTARPYLDSQLSETKNKLVQNELTMLKNSRLPTLALFGTYGYTGYGYDRKPNNFLNFYPIGFAGIQLNYTLFNGTVTQRKIKQKNLDLDNSRLQMELVNDKNNLEVKNAKLQRSAASNSMETTQKQMLWAKSIYDQTLFQQKNGTANLTDVLLADNALREAQQNYLSSTIDYLKADLELKKATNNLLNK